MALELLRANQTLMTAKIESTYGTDPTPAVTTDVIVTTEPKIEPLFVKRERKMANIGFGLGAPGLVVGEGVKITFQTEMLGSGTVGTAPHFGALLRACNLTQTISAGVSVTYAPNSSLIGESATIYFYKAGKLHKVLGCRGTAKINHKAGEIITIDFEMTGLFAGANWNTSVAFPSTQVYPTNMNSPIKFLSGSVTISAEPRVVETISFDLGNSVKPRKSGNDVGGVVSYYVSDRISKISMDPEAGSTADDADLNPYTDLQGVPTAVSLGFNCGSAGNKYAFATSRLFYDKVDEDQRENIMVYKIDGTLIPTVAGNDEFSIVFT